MKSYVYRLPYQKWYGCHVILLLWLITDLTDRIDRNKCLGIYLFNIVHQRFIFLLIHDGDDLLLGAAVIGADDIIQRRTAVEIMEDKVHDLIQLRRDDADTAL